MPYQLIEPEVEKRLGPELWKHFVVFEAEAQWQMIMAGSHIIIEATPVRMVLLRKRTLTTPRMVITYRDVAWLRDQRRGARRPKQVTLAVDFMQEVDKSVVERERSIVFDPAKHLLPGDPKRRYVLFLRQERPELLASFVNAATERPIASLGDPTNGCTSAFILDATYASQISASRRDLTAHAARTLNRLRLKADLH